MLQMQAPPISTTDHLSKAERWRILVEWNDTHLNFPADKCFHQLFEAQAARTPEAMAVIAGDQRLTYGELNARANQLAHCLQALDVAPSELSPRGAETLVGICAGRSVETIIGFLGVLKAGGTYVPLDPTYPEERLHYMIEDAQIPVVLTLERFVTGIPGSENTDIVCLDREQPRIATERTSNPDSNVQPGNLAYVIYTSGSTGKPKGVLLEHRGLCNLAAAQQQLFGLSTGDRVLQFFSLNFDGSVWEIVMALTSGAALVLASADQLAGRPLHDLLRTQQITTITTTPSVLALLPEGPLPDLHTIIAAGEACPQSLVDRWAPGRRFFNAYGPTETTVCASIYQCAAGDTQNPPIGRPLANFQLYILDDHLQPVDVGVPGELHIGGVSLARGYLNRPELTAEKFIRDPFSADPTARLYKTGDQAQFRSDGNVEFIGRNDHMVKVRGIRVEMGEIEAVLQQHPAVNQVVVAQEDTTNNKRIVAYLTPQTDSTAPVAVPETVESDVVRQWQQITDEAYKSALDDDLTLHAGGWNDTYESGKHLPKEQLQEWVDHAVDAILALKLQRVLEIGCGTGMLLFRLIPHCAYYYATDIAGQGLRYIERQLEKLAEPGWAAVELRQAAADELDDLAAGSFDTVVINSVIQYFPSMDYLVRVIEQAVKLVKPSGTIFIGDVLSYPLLEAFHTSVQLHKAAPTLSTAELANRIRRQVHEENRITIEPNFFEDLPHALPAISHVDIQLKRGRFQNELTRFRYDVTLHVGKEPITVDELPATMHWEQDVQSVAEVRTYLTKAAPPLLAVTHIPNARVLADVQAVAQLARPDRPQTAGELRAHLGRSGVESEDWWSLAADLAYDVNVTWSGDGSDGFYDVLFYPQGKRIRPNWQAAAQAKGRRPWSTYANNPLQKHEKLKAELWSYSKAKLPSYMVPSAFVLLESLPLTPSGKVDRWALPAPPDTRPPLADPYVAPSTPTQRQLAEIWAAVLNVSPIGTHDNFFDLGGHSLLLADLLTKTRQHFAVDITLTQLFEHLTIAKLAKVIEAVKQADGTETVMTGMTVAEMSVEAELAPDIRPPEDATEFVTTPVATFLTGTTGFLGASMLEELLVQTEASIYCLVRCNGNIEAAKARIEKNLRRYQLSHLLERADFDARVIPVIGDLSQPSLGIDPFVYEQLAAEIDTIYQVAANINLVYSYDLLKPINVVGCHEILRLASRMRLKPVHFISTVGVFDASEFVDNRVTFEDDQLDDCGVVYGGYAQSKWIAEKSMRNAQARGIPVAIYRPAGIWGHSKTGASNTDDMLCRMLKQWILDGTAPDLDLRFEQSSVDFVARSVVALSLQERSLGRTFQVLSPDLIHLYQVVDILNQLGYGVRIIDYGEWLERMKHIASEPEKDALGILVHYFIDEWYGTGHTYLEAGSVGRQYGVKNMLDSLKRANVSYRWIEQGFLTRCLGHLAECGYIPPPPARQGAHTNGVHNGVAHN
jgi:amino acid adenylation domain-containing protein/thioester reductase-like protein